MKKTKLFGIAMVPVMLASLPLMGMSETMTKTTTTKTTTTPNGVQATTPVSQVDITQAEVVFGQGELSLAQKKYDEALRFFQNVLTLNPVHTRAEQGMAWGYYFNGDYTEALNHINKAISLDPVNPKLLFAKARILDALGRDWEATEAYLTFAAMDPTDTSALTAITRADELHARLNPTLTPAQQAYYKGLYYLSLENPSLAIPQFTQYQQLEPNSVNAPLLLGLAYSQQNQPLEAIRYFETVTKSQPANPVAYYQLWTNYGQLGKKSEAQTAWSNFMRYAPHSEALMTPGHTPQVIGQPGQAPKQQPMAQPGQPGQPQQQH